MIARISEIIHDRAGWCPNHHALRAKNTIGGGDLFQPATVPARSAVPPGTEGSGMRKRGRYDHTQRGTLIIGAVSAAILVILITTFLAGIVWVALLVLAILAFVLSIMSTLTVGVDGETLAIRFGPVGLVRKSWPVRQIVSATEVTNPWYYGYGIRWTPHGPLYNVSGSSAVEVLLESGARFRIGTDEPAALKNAIDRARAGYPEKTRGIP